MEWQSIMAENGAYLLTSWQPGSKEKKKKKFMANMLS
jgi:hypothetical protein